jgi:hypothetical protein
MKINLKLTAPQNRFHFETCQYNDCPLEAKPNNYGTFSEDKLLWNYKKCRCSKQVRMKIARSYGMKSLGLSLRELSNMKQSIKMKSQVFSQRDNSVKPPKEEVSTDNKRFNKEVSK